MEKDCVLWGHRVLRLCFKFHDIFLEYHCEFKLLLFSWQLSPVKNDKTMMNDKQKLYVGP